MPSLTFDRSLNRLRRFRLPLVVAADLIVVALAWNVTYLFRLGFERWLSARPDYDGPVLGAVLVIYGAVFWAAGVPRAVWRYASFPEIQRLALACAAAGLIAAVVVLMAQLVGIPRAVLALHPIVTLMGLSLARLLVRMLHERARARSAGRDADGKRAVVLGAGEAARLLVAGIQHRGWTVEGLLDDDRAKHGTRVAGVPVLGGLELLHDAEALEGLTHLILAMPSASGAQRKRVLELAAASRLPVLTVPSADELRDGRSRIDRVRDIEPEDVLGREPVKLDEGGVASLVSGKVVLVTGAGGSIGSELCRQIARFGPSRLVLFELSEFALYGIEQEISERYPQLPLVRLIGDVKDLATLQRSFERWRPQLVFHAAAYKHVPLMEGDNAWLALRNNTLGTYHAALAAAQAGVERFVLISTDKAVNPTNVMGASKRAAEMVVSHLAATQPGTRFIAVRFGNVLGSSGSVIPKFKEQIAKGGPVTVTHPQITRYFMTIPEASQLVLQAAALADSGQVFVLDMGEPVTIADLARELIRLTGHTEEEIPVVFTGLRPGEKLYEELLADADTTLPTAHPRLRIAQLRGDRPDDWMERMLRYAESADIADPAVLRARLRELVPEYRPA
ncbi:MAG: polysaccharide biosynthesis protein [Aquabacterium sp.]|jgi:FlaA1/EpsC-like NDP-sugar epimerase|nr:MAG: polysaccharide biosynthesis protein [Aquabacterium sp.]TAL25560.1 MAG: polysaccharide biosynthesis protein [Aquabacterium sp.]